MRPVHLVQVDQLVCKVQLVRLDSLASLEALDCRVHAVMREPQDHKDQMAAQDRVEDQEALVAKDCKDSQVTSSISTGYVMLAVLDLTHKLNSVAVASLRLVSPSVVGPRLTDGVTLFSSLSSKVMTIIVPPLLLAPVSASPVDVYICIFISPEAGSQKQANEKKTSKK